MGREIRRVPPHWNHPTVREILTDRESVYYSRVFNYSNYDAYIALCDNSYQSAAKEWIEGFLEWHGPNGKPQNEFCKYYWEYADNPPNQAYCRPYNDEEATWYQVYETISEGTPVSPPFATQEELIDYLVKHGDFWDQKYGKNSYKNRESTEKFVKSGYAPSAVFINGKFYKGTEV